MSIISHSHRCMILERPRSTDVSQFNNHNFPDSTKKFSFCDLETPSDKRRVRMKGRKGKYVQCNCPSNVSSLRFMLMSIISCSPFHSHPVSPDSKDPLETFTQRRGEIYPPYTVPFLVSHFVVWSFQSSDSRVGFVYPLSSGSMSFNLTRPGLL